jgi:hypothetical protein
MTANLQNVFADTFVVMQNTGLTTALTSDENSYRLVSASYCPKNHSGHEDFQSSSTELHFID